jgi:hypothetical protein
MEVANISSVRQIPALKFLRLEFSMRGGLISLWLYKENNYLRDWKNVFTYSPLSSTHLWLRYSNFFNPSKKKYFGSAANRKIGNRKSKRLISTLTYVTWVSRINLVEYWRFFSVLENTAVDNSHSIFTWLIDDGWWQRDHCWKYWYYLQSQHEESHHAAP